MQSQVIFLALGLPKVIDRNGTTVRRENKGRPDRDLTKIKSQETKTKRSWLNRQSYSLTKA
jgi:hypothetical protein